MEKNVNKTLKALPAPTPTPATARKAAETSRCYKNRKPHPELTGAAVRRRVNVGDAGNLGKMTISDVQAIFGSAAAERLIVSRMTNDDGCAADEASRQAIRANLVDSLVAAGYTVTDNDLVAIMDGDYAAARQNVVKSGKVAALDAVNIAQSYEEHWAMKRERQVERGARSYRTSKSLDTLSTGAAVAYMLANATAVVAKLASMSKKLAK